MVLPKPTRAGTRSPGCAIGSSPPAFDESVPHQPVFPTSRPRRFASCQEGDRERRADRLGSAGAAPRHRRRPGRRRAGGPISASVPRPRSASGDGRRSSRRRRGSASGRATRARRFARSAKARAERASAEAGRGERLMNEQAWEDAGSPSPRWPSSRKPRGDRSREAPRRGRRLGRGGLAARSRRARGARERVPSASSTSTPPSRPPVAVRGGRLTTARVVRAAVGLLREARKAATSRLTRSASASASGSLCRSESSPPATARPGRATPSSSRQGVRRGALRRRPAALPRGGGVARGGGGAARAPRTRR